MRSQLCQPQKCCICKVWTWIWFKLFMKLSFVRENKSTWKCEKAHLSYLGLKVKCLANSSCIKNSSEQMLLLHLEETHWSSACRSRGLQSGKYLVFPFWIKTLVPSLVNLAPRAPWPWKERWKALHLSRPALADETSQHTKASSGTPCSAISTHGASRCSWGNPAQTCRDWTQHLAGNGGGFELCYKTWFAFESRHASICDSGH